MDEIEILLNEKKEIVIADRKYKIGKLTIKQVLKLTKFLAKNIFNSNNKLQEYRKTIENRETTNIEDILIFLDLLSEDLIAELFCILLNEDDKEFLINNLDLSCITGIIANVLEYNDINVIKKNVQAIASKLQTQN